MKILQERLLNFQAKGLTRVLTCPQGIDLSSSDYLSFAKDNILRQRYLDRLKKVPNGAAGSRLLRGNLSLFEETESKLADFVGRESALLFSTGYAANIGLLSALLQKEDIVFSDALNHASIIDGISLSKAEKIIFPHRDYVFLEKSLQENAAKNRLKLIITESLFSMEGTLADLKHLASLAEKYDALLIVDEAHSTGIWGKSLVSELNLSHKVFASIHPAGKALGASGAWVACDHFFKEYLIHFARSFVFSTAPLPAIPLLLQEVVKYYQEIGDARALTVRQKARWFRDILPVPTLGETDSPIVPIVIGDNERAVEVAKKMQMQGWDVRAIRPPTVPEGTARLRVTVKWENSEAELERFVGELSKIVEFY